jgi:hypothetical protein
MSYFSPIPNYFNIDENSPQDELPNYFYDPFNLRGFSIFNEIDEIKNDIFNTNLLDDYNNENNNNHITNNINDKEPNAYNEKMQTVFATSNNEKNIKTASSSKAITTNSTKICNEPKTDNKPKLGRKRKDEINDEDIDNDKVHTKEKPDNIKVRFKRIFFSNLIDNLNKRLKESSNPKLNSLMLKKLNSDFVKSLKKDVITNMLDSPASVVLSQKIAKKYKRFDEYHNREIINLIYEENEESLITILSKYTRELIEAFLGNTDDDSLFKNYSLEDSIKKLSKKETKGYIEKFRNEAQHFEETFREISGRNRTSKKDKKIIINSI